MTTNQTIDGVPRALLEVFAGPRNNTPEQMRKAMDELRALLDAPAQCDHEFESPALSSMPDYCAKCAIDKPAAMPQDETPDDDKSHPRFIAGYTAGLHDYKLGQPQGEPVAIERLSIQMLKGGLFRYDSDPEGPLVRYQDHAEQVKLYASQPAPVAVVLPPPGPDPQVEARAKEIYEGWSYNPGFIPWVDGGNSSMQDKARDRARRELASK